MEPQNGLLEHAVKSLIVSGPLAVVLGAGIVVVWRAYRELHKDFISFLMKGFAVGDDKEKKP